MDGNKNGEKSGHGTVTQGTLKILIWGAIILLAYVLLFSFRAYDDNSLFSWSWVFTRTNASLVYLLLIAALGAASVLSRVPVPETADRALLAGLTAVAVLPFWTEPELIIDASRYFAQAKYLSAYGIGAFLREWGGGVFAWTDLPLVPFCYGVLFKLFGEGRMVIQSFTTLLFACTALLTYRVGRTLWDRETGLSAGMLLLGIPYLLPQVPLFLVDVPVMFLLMLALAEFLGAIERGGGPRTARAVASLVLLALAKYSAWIALSLFIVTAIVTAVSGERPGGPRRLLRGVLIMACAVVVAGIILFPWRDVVASQIRLLREYQVPGLERWSEGMLSTFLFQVHPLIALFSVAAAARAAKHRDLRFLIAAWLLLLAVVFSVQRARYLLPAFPLLTLMAAYGLQVVRTEDVRRFAVFGTVAVSLVVATAVYLPFARSMGTVNVMRAGEHLDRIGAKDVTVVSSAGPGAEVGPVAMLALLDLFTEARLRFDPLTAVRLPEPSVRERSSLRFTWEFPLPSYIMSPPETFGDIPVVVLGDGGDRTLPETIGKLLSGYRRIAAYHVHEGVFLHAPFVDLYVKADAPGKAAHK